MPIGSPAHLLKRLGGEAITEREAHQGHREADCAIRRRTTMRIIQQRESGSEVPAAKVSHGLCHRIGRRVIARRPVHRQAAQQSR